MVERSAEEDKGIIVDEARILATIERALEARRNKEGLFIQAVVPPERDFIELAKKYGEEIGSEVFVLHALFFLSTTIYADDSTRLLKRVAKPQQFRHYAWIFQPEKVHEYSNSEVVWAAKQLIKPGYNVRALADWQHNASVIVEKYDGDLRNFFAEHDNDAPKILKALVGPARKKDWEGFRRFGPKLGRLFLQWVQQYGLADLKNTEEIGVPVDFQVARLIIQTGGIHLSEPTHKGVLQEKILTLALAKLCQQNKLSPQLVSETLWLIGNRCCNNYAHHLCPLACRCDRLISRSPFDESGFFDPADVGRERNRGGKIAEKKRKQLIEAGQTEMPLFNSQEFPS